MSSMVPRAGAPASFADLTAPEVNPGVSETWYDGADQDCAGDDDFDQDGDGVRSDTHPDGEGLVGDDCDDTTDSTYPGAPEEWYDGVDADSAAAQVPSEPQ